MGLALVYLRGDEMAWETKTTVLMPLTGLLVTILFTGTCLSWAAPTSSCESLYRPHDPARIGNEKVDRGIVSEMIRFRAEIEKSQSSVTPHLLEIWRAKFQQLNLKEQEKVLKGLSTLRRLQSGAQELRPEKQVLQNQKLELVRRPLVYHPDLVQVLELKSDPESQIDVGPFREKWGNRPGNSLSLLRSGVTWGKSGRYALLRTQAGQEAQVIDLKNNSVRVFPATTRLSRDGEWISFPQPGSQAKAITLEELTTGKTFTIMGEQTWENLLFDNLFFALQTKNKDAFWQIIQPKTGRTLIAKTGLAISSDRRTIAFIDAQDQFRAYDTQTWLEISTPIRGKTMKGLGQNGNVSDRYFYGSADDLPVTFDLDTKVISTYDITGVDGTEPLVGTPFFQGFKMANGGPPGYRPLPPQHLAKINEFSQTIFFAEVGETLILADRIDDHQFGITTLDRQTDRFQRQSIKGDLDGIDPSGLVFMKTEKTSAAYDPITNETHWDLPMSYTQIAAVSTDRKYIYWKGDVSKHQIQLAATSVVHFDTSDTESRFVSISPDQKSAILQNREGVFVLLRAPAP